MSDKIYLSRKEASAFLHDLGLFIAPSTLAKLATTGGGPRFRRFGRQVKYLVSDLIAWAMARFTPPVGSTSEFGDGGSQKSLSNENEDVLLPVPPFPPSQDDSANSLLPGCE